jgi:transcriptional regulator with XRE-family HTH domain
MAPIQTAKPDGAKIRELIKARGYSGVTDFANTICRPRQSIWNIIGYEPQTGLVFLRQIARGLGVTVSDISNWTGGDPGAMNPRHWLPADDIESEPEPKGTAA